MALQPPLQTDNANSQCHFRTDIDPRPDIQMLDVYDKIPFDNEDGGPWKQGWRITYDPHEWNSHHKLKVFVVPHSHNDPGWIKTFDEYYDQLTKPILNNMLHQLLENADMKFIWAEISYFSRWYDNLSTEDQNDVKMYVWNWWCWRFDWNCYQLIACCLFRLKITVWWNAGNWSLLLAGGWWQTKWVNLMIIINSIFFLINHDIWTMHNFCFQANSHWLSMLLQLTEGQTWLKTHLNVTPKSSWSIDPFGQSSVMPVILKGSDFENLLIQRTHYEVKKYLARRKELEFRWRQLWGKFHLTNILSYIACHSWNVCQKYQ